MHARACFGEAPDCPDRGVRPWFAGLGRKVVGGPCGGLRLSWFCVSCPDSLRHTARIGGWSNTMHAKIASPEALFSALSLAMCHGFTIPE